MKSKTNIGVAFLIAGFLMFLIGMILFSYDGPVNSIFKGIGIMSIILWLPTFIIGVIVLFYARKHMNDEMKE